MPLKQQLEQDIKQAMLGGDKDRVTTLRGLKSVVLYAEVAQGLRDQGLPDNQILVLFAKEAKKRQESAELYEKGGSSDRAAAELAEKAIIEGYLPQQMSDDELAAVVDAVLATLDLAGASAMGAAIGQVKAKVAGRAGGARIAQIVKERLVKA